MLVLSCRPGTTDEQTSTGFDRACPCPAGSDANLRAGSRWWTVSSWSAVRRIDSARTGRGRIELGVTGTIWCARSWPDGVGPGRPARMGFVHADLIWPGRSAARLHDLGISPPSPRFRGPTRSACASPRNYHRLVAPGFRAEVADYPLVESQGATACHGRQKPAPGRRRLTSSAKTLRANNLASGRPADPSVTGNSARQPRGGGPAMDSLSLGICPEAGR